MWGSEAKRTEKVEDLVVAGRAGNDLESAASSLICVWGRLLRRAMTSAITVTRFSSETVWFWRMALRAVLHDLTRRSHTPSKCDPVGETPLGPFVGHVTFDLFWVPFVQDFA